MTDKLIEGVYAPDDFFRRFATAILSWQGVEHELYLLFLGCVSPKNPDIAGAIFFDQQSFGQKLNLVKSVMKVCLSDLYKDEWKKVLKKIDSSVIDRNVLAHLSVAADFNDDNTFGLAMVFPLMSPKEIRRTRKRKYDTAGCSEVWLEFEALAASIREFRTGLLVM
jgi:hypothetical protein